MATITKGQTYGVAEQITNTKLHNLVDLATITGILASEMANSFVTSLASASGKIPPQNLWELKTVATNSSVPSLATGTMFKLHWATYGSIASFSNAKLGQKFTLIAGQASFPVIVDTGNFLLSANWIPDTAGDNLTLVWDGTNFIEVGRTNI